jgi:hypothetical protein
MREFARGYRCDTRSSAALATCFNATSGIGCHALNLTFQNKASPNRGNKMRKLFCLLALAGAACVWSAGVVAQSKIAWSDSCGKANPDYTVQVEDPGSHSFGLGQLKCHPTKPVEIGEVKGKEAVVTYFTDSSGDKSREHGMYVLTLESGDKVSLPSKTLKDGKPTGANGTWSFAAGTGKLKGDQWEGHLALLSGRRGVELQRRG